MCDEIESLYVFCGKILKYVMLVQIIGEVRWKIWNFLKLFFYYYKLMNFKYKKLIVDVREYSGISKKQIVLGWFLECILNLMGVC